MFRRQLDTTEDDLPLPHRQRLNEEVELEPKRTLEPEDVSSSKVQRISAIVTPDFADVKGPVYDAKSFRRLLYHRAHLKFLLQLMRMRMNLF